MLLFHMSTVGPPPPLFLALTPPTQRACFSFFSRTLPSFFFLLFSSLPPTYQLFNPNSILPLCRNFPPLPFKQGSISKDCSNLFCLLCPALPLSHTHSHLLFKMQQQSKFSLHAEMTLLTLHAARLLVCFHPCC